MQRIWERRDVQNQVKVVIDGRAAFVGKIGTVEDDYIRVFIKVLVHSFPYSVRLIRIWLIAW